MWRVENEERISSFDLVRNVNIQSEKTTEYGRFRKNIPVQHPVCIVY